MFPDYLSVSYDYDFRSIGNLNENRKLATKLIKKMFLARYVPTLKALNQEHIILADLTIPIGKKFKNN